MSLHPLLERAAEGELPPWACAGDDRRAHMERVASLLERWAVARRLPELEVRRWRAAGWLHDVVRDSAPAHLLPLVPAHLHDLPESLLHGPAAAARLAAEGVRDGPFLLALGYHTVGHPGLDRMGRALYAADYLEPGRPYESAASGELRARLEEDDGRAFAEVMSRRIGRLLDRRHPMRMETLEFWNAVVAAGGSGDEQIIASKEARDEAS